MNFCQSGFWVLAFVAIVAEAYAIDPALVKKIKADFAAIDSNADAVASREEFLMPGRLAADFSRTDTDANGFVTSDEFVTHALLRIEFERTDADADGFVTVDEFLRDYRNTLAPRVSQWYPDLGPEEIAKKHERNRRTFVEPVLAGDKNNDGKLSFDELKAYNDHMEKLLRAFQ